MKKRCIYIVVVLILLFTVSAHAVTPRTTSITPYLTFDGTEATCKVSIIANKATDRIDATMELKQGNTVIDSWSASGYLVLQLTETATVAKKKTYTLVVNSTINGVAQPTVTVSETNN